MSFPSLPEEIYLHIFTFIEPQELWLSVRAVSKLFNRVIESYLKTSAIPFFVMGINYTLDASTSHHRYDVTHQIIDPGGSTDNSRYDVRTSVFISYNSMDKENADLAFFDKMTVHHEPYHGRAMKKWEEIALTGLDADTEWRVQLRNGNPRTCEMRFVKLPSAMISETGVLCAWKELLTVYFGACRAA